MIESGQDDEIQNNFEHKVQWGKLFKFKVIKKNDNDGLSEADGTSGTILRAKRI